MTVKVSDGLRVVIYYRNSRNILVEVDAHAAGQTRLSDTLAAAQQQPTSGVQTPPFPEHDAASTRAER